MDNFEERIKVLYPKLTLLTGAKGEGDSEFTFQDLYDIEYLMDSRVKLLEDIHARIEQLEMMLSKGLFEKNWAFMTGKVDALRYVVDALEVT